MRQVAELRAVGTPALTTMQALQRVQQLSQAHSQVIVAVDYFFLQPSEVGYFSSHYGNNWISVKVPALIHAGATSCILPRSAYIIAMENKPNECRGQASVSRIINCGKQPSKPTAWILSQTKAVMETKCVGWMS